MRRGHRNWVMTEEAVEFLRWTLIGVVVGLVSIAFIVVVAGDWG